MNKTNFIDLLRFIQKSLVSFLSIGIFMGVSFAVFIGIFSSAESLRVSTDDSYSRHQYADLQITSSLGFTEKDVAAYRQLKEVSAVQGSRETFGWTDFHGNRHLTYFMEYSEKLNRYGLIAGEMPRKANECAIDNSLNYSNGLEIGDTIDVAPFEDKATGLIHNKLIITAYVTHPYALSKDKENRRGFAPYGDGAIYTFILLHPSAFEPNLFKHTYSSLYLTVEGASQHSSFSKAYRDVIKAAKRPIEQLTQEREDLRYDYLRGKARIGLDQVKSAVSLMGLPVETNDMVIKAQERLDDIEAANWNLFDRYTNTSFLEVDAFATSLTNISWSFSIIFVVVSIIIVFTMLSRLIDEQRLYTGIKKSVGFTTREIMNFFLLYAFFSSLVGIAIGFPLNFFIEELSYDSYAGRFWFNEDRNPLVFLPQWAVGVYAILTVIALLATVVAVYASAKEHPNTLLLGEKPPKNIAAFFKKIIPRWDKLDTFTKMIICNIFSSAKRLISVISGIAGSLSLLLIGILMHSSILSVPLEQGKITTYDQLVICDDPNPVRQVLDHTDNLNYLRVKEINCAFEFGELMGASTLTCLPDGYEPYLNLKDPAGKTIQVPETAALVSTKIAELSHLKVGSTLTLSCADREIQVIVGGIFQNYAFNSVIISPTYYETLFEKKVLMNQFYVDYDAEVSEAAKQHLVDQLKTQRGFLSVKNANRFDGYFISMAENLMAVLMILIVLATFLIAVVIYNTVVMNILRRKSELAMLMLNGFSRKDIRRYIAIEFWTMALLSIAIGTVLGCFFAVEVEKVVEPIYCQFVRTSGWLPIAKGVGLALILAVVLNQFAMRLLNKVKITDAMR